MVDTIVKYLLQFVTSEMMEKLIGIAVRHLVKSQDSGISKELTETMIKGVIASQSNPIKEMAFTRIRETLKQAK